MLVAAEFFNGEPFTIDIRSTEAVACGGTAQIFVGDVIWENLPFVVAVKVFKTMLNITEKKLLRRELEIASRVSVRHRSIVAFLGTAKIGLETSIVSLYMRNGNLLDYLKLNQEVDRKKLILEVAEAVDYLHTVEGLVHGDLKCANVLISDFGVALLADFGLSTFIEKAQSSATTATDARAKYTLRFAAPELFNDSAGYPRRRSKTRETDVYAFGMLVLEALTGQSPWLGLTDMAVLLRVNSGMVPSQPTTNGPWASISHAWWDVLKQCWSYNPVIRPPMKTVLDALTMHSHLPVRFMNSLDFIRKFVRILASAYMPSGRRLAWISETHISSREQGCVDLSIYDMVSGRTVAGPVPGPPTGGRNDLLLFVTPDGAQIITTTSSVIVRWDLESGVLHSQRRFNESVDYCAISPDAQWIASQGIYNGDSASVFLCASTSEELFGEPLGRHNLHPSCMAFSPDSSHLLSGSSAHRAGELFLWNVSTRERLAAARDPGPVDCVCFLPNGEHILSCSDDGQVRIWNAGTLKLKHIVGDGTLRGILSVAASFSGKYVAFVSGGGMLRVWDTKNWEPFVVSETSELSSISSPGYKFSLEFSPTGKSIMCCTDFGIQIWDLAE